MADIKQWKLSTALATSGICFMAAPAYAANDIDPGELLNLSLEQLSNIQVTSVSKREEKASEAAAAIFVITQDDIRRSGATSIPEVLRIVPGLDVAQAGSHQWAISSRGFNSQFANKLLVLIDGRSVYTPLFSGVYWDVQDTILDDIERIEVIRGPGATLWGANAVNGVINIITKEARDTQGTLVSASRGNQDNALTSLRHGAKIGEDAHMRVYAKYDDRDSLETLTQTNLRDPWNKSQGGFRADWKDNSRNSYTLQGDAYRAGESGTLNLPIVVFPGSTPTQDREIDKGGNLLGRWNHEFSDISNITLQMYYDYAQRSNILYNDKQYTMDFDFTHAWNVDKLHEVVWGVGYRRVTDDFTGLQMAPLLGAPYVSLSPTQRTDNLYSYFIQDKIALVPDEFFLTPGAKLELNDYTGFEFQPSLRFSWLVDDTQTIWGSVARAVRTPNRFSDNGSLVIGSGPGFYTTTLPNTSTVSEVLIAYELGYRVYPTKTLSLDIATFYNDYSKLFTNSLGGGAPLVTITPINGNAGRTYGLEVAPTWDVTPNWQLSAGYSYLNFKLEKPDNVGFSTQGASPKQQANIRSAVQLPHNVEVSNALYYVDSLVGIAIPAYTRFDTRVAWKPIESLELSIVGQNLFDDRHQEFSAFLLQNRAQIPRSVYGNITWKF